MPFDIKECVEAAQEGEQCGGFMLPCFYEACGAGLMCTGDQLAVSIPHAYLLYHGTVLQKPYSREFLLLQVDGPGTCSCIAEPGSGNVNADNEVSILDIVLGGEYSDWSVLCA